MVIQVILPLRASRSPSSSRTFSASPSPTMRWTGSLPAVSVAFSSLFPSCRSSSASPVYPCVRVVPPFSEYHICLLTIPRHVWQARQSLFPPPRSHRHLPPQGTRRLFAQSLPPVRCRPRPVETMFFLCLQCVRVVFHIEFKAFTAYRHLKRSHTKYIYIQRYEKDTRLVHIYGFFWFCFYEKTGYEALGYYWLLAYYFIPPLLCLRF